MELRHQFTVPASVEETWAAFNDPEMVVPCFPGATLISVEGDHFNGSAKVKLGPIALQYSGTGTYLQRDEVTRLAVIEAKGRDKRGNGTATAKVTAQLRPDGEGTAVNVTTDLSVTGKPAQFGRGVMQDVSDNMLEQFVACLQAHLSPPQAAPSTPAGPDSEQHPREGVAAPRAALPQPSAPAGAELNLLSTVVPIVLKHYAAPLLGVVGLLAGYLLGRRRRPSA
jgi:carbon monoxide dehydrogenase subunit G